MPFSTRPVGALRRLVKDFSERDAEHIKNIEAETNHDVKAIEYWLRSKLGTNKEAQAALEFVHFACTSEDVNNLSYALMLRESRDKVMLPRLDALVEALRALARRHAAVPMLARTHGQAATPTTLGKEMANFAHRLARARERIGAVSVLGKVNGAVGNVGIANALLRHLADKLPVSRWQRDLSDSTAQRNIGTALGHTLLAYASAQRGLGKLQVDSQRLAADLEQNWEVLAEAVQQVMRRHGVADAYEKLKAISRGKRLERRALAQFVKSLPIPAEAKKRLLALTPARYTGLAAELARRV